MWTACVWGQPLVGGGVDGKATIDVQDTSETSQCWLVADNEFRDRLSAYLGGKSKLIEMTLNLRGHPEDMLSHSLKDFYNPYTWIRSTSRQGRSLLTLGDNYRYKSMMTLSIGVVSLDVDVSDLPVRCLRGRNPEQTLNIIRQSFFRNFIGPTGENKSTFGAEEHLCNMQVFKEGQYAKFQYRCCRLGTGGNMVCHDLVQDDWIKFLLVLIIIIKVLIVLYSPLFLPDSLYRQKYVAGQYIYHVPVAPMTLKVAVTQDPDQFGEVNRHKTVRLSGLKNMEYFKAMLSNSHSVPDKIYEINVQEVRLSVKSRRLLEGVSVPVTLTTLLYNNLLRCRLRRLEPLKECCASGILGKFNPGFKFITWHQCLTRFAQFCLLTILATPWIIRSILYFAYEAAVIEDKKRMAKEMGLKLRLPSSVVLHLTPIHGLFLVIYIIFIIDSVAYGVISSGMKEKLKYVTRQCLRDMKERSRVAILAWIAKLTVMPFRLFGVVGLVFFLPYLAIVIVISLPFVAFYIFPTLNLSFRLLCHFFAFMCPQGLTKKFQELSEKLAPVKKQLKLREVTANENFVDRHRYTTKGIILQLIVIIMCLISFWSLTLLLMEVVSFFVEIFVYTFMGVIVNAGVILHYLAVLLMVVVYSKNTFSRVYRLYQSYHKIIHRQLMAMARDEVTQVAKQEALDQENTAFIVHGEATTDKPVNVSPQIRVKNHQLQWKTFGMLVFLDMQDTPLTPEKFFYKTIQLNYFGCPGPIYRNVCSAVWDFLKILLFLMFVFVVVMALGDAYQISTTNQLLATVVGSFVPFIFRYFFPESSSVDHIDASSIQFKTELNKAINTYTQSWPVFDLIPVSLKEWEMHELANIPDEKPLNPKLTPPRQLSSLSGNSTEEDDDDCEDGTMEDTHAGGDSAEVVNYPDTAVSETAAMPEVDIIIDVSSSKTRTVNALLLKDFEKGSMSMLDRHDKNSDSKKMYKSHEDIV